MDADPTTTAACAFGDPTCPCRDGDVCHYVDDPLSETLAMTPPTTAAQHHRTVKVWAPDWYVRPDDAPKVACGAVEHHADTWFLDCEHTPQVWDYTESARALCDETDADADILEAIAKVYFMSWSLHRRQGVNHVEQWPLALTVLAGLREAGFEVVRRAD